MYKICKQCGKQYLPRKYNVEYCSDECRQEHIREYARMQQRRRKLPESMRKKETKECIICGKTFVAKTVRSVCCSAGCKEERVKQLRSINAKKYRSENKQYADAWLIDEEEEENPIKKGIDFNEITPEQKIHYGKTQTKAFADDFKVIIPQGLMKAKERVKI